MEIIHSIQEFGRNECSSFFEGNYLEDFKDSLLARFVLARSELVELVSVAGWSGACDCHREHAAFGSLRRCLFLGPRI